MGQNFKKTYLIGNSGHGHVLVDTASINGISVEGYFQAQKNHENPFLLSYLGHESDCDDSFFASSKFLIGIGNNQKRSEVYNFIKSKKGMIQTLIHPSTFISKLSSIQEGCFVNTQAIIHVSATIGVNSIINTSAIIEHDCQIGAHSHIAPGAILCGNVNIGEYSLIGAGAIVRQGINIGSNVTVGAGSVVIKDIPDDKTVIGNPSRYVDL